jgi:cytochrome c553
MKQSRWCGLVVTLCLAGFPLIQAQAAQVGSAELVAKGEKLAKMCDTCHTVMGPDGKPVIGELAGGKVAVPGAAGANLTPSPSGIGKFTEKMFDGALRDGEVDGRKLKVMNPVLFRSLSDDDLHAIWVYLRQLPKVNHIVDNTKPATPCKKCGQVHGGGDQN